LSCDVVLARSSFPSIKFRKMIVVLDVYR
jgi:hypothetical protein